MLNELCMYVAYSYSFTVCEGYTELIDYSNNFV